MKVGGRFGSFGFARVLARGRGKTKCAKCGIAKTPSAKKCVGVKI